MGLIETEALILRTYDLSDADKIVVFLTGEEGLVRGVAKGARRLKSKFGSALEPFSIVNIVFFKKEERELVSINQIELKRSFFSVACEPAFLLAYSYFSELLQAFAPPHDPNERLYKMTTICLEVSSTDEKLLSGIVVYFELWLLKLGGYLPSWDRCTACGRQQSETEELTLEADFAATCGNCKRRGKKGALGPGVREVFRRGQKSSPLRFAEMFIDRPSEIETLSKILKKIISRILNREITGTVVPSG